MSIKTERFVNNYSATLVGGTNAALFTMIVPTKCKWRLLSFGNYTDTVAAWTVIYWSFEKNGQAIFPYDAILDQLGYGPQRSPMQAIEVMGGSTITVRAFNPTAGNVAMGISLEYELEYQDT
jgi:hypothetical protein